MIQLREIRDSLLNQTDWTRIPDNDLSWLQKKKVEKISKTIKKFSNRCREAIEK